MKTLRFCFLVGFIAVQSVFFSLRQFGHLPHNSIKIVLYLINLIGSLKLISWWHSSPNHVECCSN